MQIKCYKKIVGQIACVTGLHIGGAAEQIEIGGVDLPIIKHPITNEPYIPGSSLKGKMRSQLEKRNFSERIKNIEDNIRQISAKNGDEREKRKIIDTYEKYKRQIQGGEPCGCGLKSCQICIVFGPHKNTDHDLGSTRIIVRDAILSEESRQSYKSLIAEKGISYIEKKFENSVNRKSGTARDPRSQERVPAGAKFDFEIVLQMYEGDHEDKIIDFVKEGLREVQQTYLGGFGSRGSGKVKFTALKLDGNDFTI
jgi:CRISPR-associated protein Csm3